MRNAGCLRLRRCPMLLLLVLAAGCFDSSAVVPERYPPEKAAEVALETYDADGDGKIAGAELDACLALKYALPRVDTSGDKSVTADEIAERMRVLDNQSDLMGTTVQVMSRGGPVTGATAVLELEPFMGADLPLYTAAIDESGSGAPKLQGSDEAVIGIPLGFYRVTITPPDGGEVVRGCEVADDSPTSNRLVFSLEDEGPLVGGGRAGYGRR